MTGPALASPPPPVPTADDDPLVSHVSGRTGLSFGGARGERVLPELPKRGTIRVWSGGCAAGEEAYTSTMLLTGAGAGLSGRYAVLGTDLSSAAVTAARAGTYGRWSLRGLEEASVSRFFDADEAGFHVREHLRVGVTFQQHNLLDPLFDGRGPFDLVLRPSATVLFRSLARSLGSSAAGVLTGMGRDGLEGLRELRAAGGRVLAQDEESSVVFGMPGAATAAGVAHLVGPVEQLAADLAGTMRRRPS